jgi:SAM-dependent methyltransferase
MPWGILIAEIEALVRTEVPQGGTLLDILCGTGDLLRRLHALRPDIRYTGVDLEQAYIDFAQTQTPKITFEVGDALLWHPQAQFDAVTVTGGLHHIPYAQQEAFVKKIAGHVAQGGFAIVGDPYIDDYANEMERKIAGAKLGYEYLAATIQNGADDEVIEATIGILANDVKLVEYKSSIAKIKPLFEKHFGSVELHKTWPAEESAYGDYYFILRK